MPSHASFPVFDSQSIGRASAYFISHILEVASVYFLLPVRVGVRQLLSLQKDIRPFVASPDFMGTRFAVLIEDVFVFFCISFSRSKCGSFVGKGDAWYVTTAHD